jgi:hypothetical protein
VYGAFVASIGDVPAVMRIRVCASEKGKPVLRRGRKALGPPSWEVAGLWNGRGGATKLRPYKEERERMRRSDGSDVFHARLVLPSSNLLHDRACGR